MNIHRRNPQEERLDLDAVIEIRGGETKQWEFRPKNIFRPDGFIIEPLEGDIRCVQLIQFWVGHQFQLVVGPVPLMTLENLTVPTVEIGNNLSALFANYGKPVRFKWSWQGRETAP